MSRALWHDILKWKVPPKTPASDASRAMSHRHAGLRPLLSTAEEKQDTPGCTQQGRESPALMRILIAGSCPDTKKNHFEVTKSSKIRDKVFPFVAREREQAHEQWGFGKDSAAGIWQGGGWKIPLWAAVTQEGRGRAEAPVLPPHSPLSAMDCPPWHRGSRDGAHGPSFGTLGSLRPTHKSWRMFGAGALPRSSLGKGKREAAWRCCSTCQRPYPGHCARPLDTGRVPHLCSCPFIPPEICFLALIHKFVLRKVKANSQASSVLPLASSLTPRSVPPQPCQLTPCSPLLQTLTAAFSCPLVYPQPHHTKGSQNILCQKGPTSIIRPCSGQPQ